MLQLQQGKWMMLLNHKLVNNLGAKTVVNTKD